MIIFFYLFLVKSVFHRVVIKTNAHNLLKKLESLCKGKIVQNFLVKNIFHRILLRRLMSIIYRKKWRVSISKRLYKIRHEFCYDAPKNILIFLLLIYF